MADAENNAPKKAPKKTTQPRAAAKRTAPKKKTAPRKAAKKAAAGAGKSAPKKAAPKKAQPKKKGAPKKKAAKKSASARGGATKRINPREAAARVSATGAAASHATRSAGEPQSEDKKKLRAAVRDVISKNEPQPPPHEKHLRLRVDENLSRGQDTVQAKAIEKLFGRIEEFKAEHQGEEDERILGMPAAVTITLFFFGIVVLGFGIKKFIDIRKESKENAPTQIAGAPGAGAEARPNAASTVKAAGVIPDRFMPRPGARPNPVADQYEEVSEQPEGKVILSFPTNRSMGELQVRPRGVEAGSAGWMPAGSAKGNVAIKAEQEIQIKLGAEGVADLSPLDKIPAEIVKELFVDFGGVTDDHAPHIRRLRSLQLIRMPNCRISDGMLEAMSGMSDLSILNVANTGITDKGIAHLAGLKNLKRLAIQGTSLTDAAVDHLVKMSGLQMLWIEQTGITDAGRERIKKALPEVVFSK